MTRKEKFLSLVEFTDTCWNWKGAKTNSGYGQFYDGEMTAKAHWYLLDKYPDKGMDACHHCDNRLCVRPSHIFIGTRSENMRDCVRKGRNNPRTPAKLEALKRARLARKPTLGSQQFNAKLKESDVALILAIGQARGRGVFFAKLFGVLPAIISKIYLKTGWKHVHPTEADFARAKEFVLQHPEINVCRVRGGVRAIDPETNRLLLAT